MLTDEQCKLPTEALPAPGASTNLATEVLKSPGSRNESYQISNRYIITHRIRNGATGTLFKGFDSVTEKYVAIKVFHEEIPFTRQAISAFTKTLPAMQGITHTGIVKTHACIPLKDITLFGTTYKKTYAIVMDYVFEHRSLTHFLDGTPIKEELITDLFPKILDALQALHDAGLTHRSISPSNILISDDLEIKISDYSPFNFIDEDIVQSANRQFVRAQYTPPPFYNMSFADKDIDLYAVAILLLEALTGDCRSSAVEATDVASVLARVNHAAPKRILNTLPDRYHYIIRKAIRENKAERYPTATKMSRDFFQDIKYYEEALLYRSCAMLIESYENKFYIPKASQVIRRRMNKIAPAIKFASIALGSFWALVVTLMFL